MPATSKGATGERMLTVREVCAALNVSRWTVSRIIDDGELSVVRVGRAVRVRESALQRYVNTREEGRVRRKRTRNKGGRTK